MLVTEFGMVTLWRDSHQLKAPYPMLVTEFGMVMLWRDLQHPKASSPMLFTEFGIVTLWRNMHQLKASSPMLVTEFGMVMLWRYLHELKVPSQITSVPSLTTYSFSRNEEEAFNSFFPSRLYLTPYSSSIASFKLSSECLMDSRNSDIRG